MIKRARSLSLTDCDQAERSCSMTVGCDLLALEVES
jgi:hypothetical protein